MLPWRPVPLSEDRPEHNLSTVTHPNASLDDSIVDLLRSAPCEDATEALRTFWSDYLPHRADVLATRIRALPVDVWEAESTLLLALARCHRSAPASNPFAALSYLDAARQAATDPTIGVPVAVARARALCGLGQVADARRELAAARTGLTTLGLHSRLSLEATIFFVEGQCDALAGDVDIAAHRLRHGLGLLPPGVREPAAVEALGWLAFTEYLTAEAGAPALTVERALALANDMGSGPVVELAPALLVLVMIAIDEARTADAASIVGELDAVVVGTEYSVFTQYLKSILDGVLSGPSAQLDRLQTVQLAIHGWQTPTMIGSLHDEERAHALIDLGAVGSARDAATEVSRRTGLSSRHALCPAVTRARLALHVGDFEGALEVTAACRALGDRHAPRSLAYVDVLRAAAHAALGDSATAARAVDRVLLQAARTGWRRHLTSLPYGHFDAMLQRAASRTQPPEVRTVIEELQSRTAPEVCDIAPALSARERVVLDLIVDGDSRQQISSRLNVSPNTVKAQVRSIYRKLGAANRHEAVDKAIKSGLTRS